MNNAEKQTIALAAFALSIKTVCDIALKGIYNHKDIDLLVRSIWKQNPKTILEIYGDDLSKLRNGFIALDTYLQSTQQGNILQYAMHLESLAKILKDNGKNLRNTEYKIRQTNILMDNENIDEAIDIAADLYVKNVSPLKKQLRIVGEKNHLTVEHNVKTIRALLLAGVRAAFLWHQLGGSIWVLPFQTSTILNFIRKTIS